MAFAKKTLNKLLGLTSQHKKMLLIAYDNLLIHMASFLAIWLRFDFSYSEIPLKYMMYILYYAPLNTLVTLLLFRWRKMYSSVWSFAGTSEVLNTLVASLLSGVIMVGATMLLGLRMPIAYYVMFPVFLMLGATGARLIYRVMRYLNRNNEKGPASRKLMMVGAGEAGNIILREITESPLVEGRVVCIIDDNPTKKGKYLSGVPIVGGRDMLIETAKDYGVNEIIIAIPSASPKTTKKIVELCNTTGCHVQILPGMYQFLNHEVGVSKLRRVDIEDLLGRDSIKVNIDEIAGYVTNHTVLVTGGGGSIGSELCRQIASEKPKRLVILDIYENNAYDIQQELKRAFPELELSVVIASVRDNNRIEQVFETYRPDIVYHAAAHKHVPLMEDSPQEAIKNNVFGTWNVALAAAKYNARRFVLISTDKAVNPTNIMGASKRMCEMVIQTVDKLRREHRLNNVGIENPMCKTEFVAVRFGNVLGSNGSVVPVFRRQIKEGGPVTVTHPDIIRYFMTIPEAVSLVLQAGAYAKGGEIFVLDMGEPVKIDDLARNMIKLSGFTPDVDIKIEYTGLRPGEKLFEELLLSEEGIVKTQNSQIYIGSPLAFDTDVFLTQLERLRAILRIEGADVKTAVAGIVGTYSQAAPPVAVVAETAELEVVEKGKKAQRAERVEPQAAGVVM